MNIRKYKTASPISDYIFWRIRSSINPTCIYICSTTDCDDVLFIYIMRFLIFVLSCKTKLKSNIQKPFSPPYENSKHKPPSVKLA